MGLLGFSRSVSTPGPRSSQSYFATTPLRELEGSAMATECRQDSLDFVTVAGRAVVGAFDRLAAKLRGSKIESNQAIRRLPWLSRDKGLGGRAGGRAPHVLASGTGKAKRGSPDAAPACLLAACRTAPRRGRQRRATGSRRGVPSRLVADDVNRPGRRQVGCGRPHSGQPLMSRRSDANAYSKPTRRLCALRVAYPPPVPPAPRSPGSAHPG